MGLFDKLKNVFFEEEYVEVEEPVKKEKVTVAKKIETPEVKKVREEAIKVEKKNVVEPDETKEFPKQVEHDFKFPMDFDEKDFEVEDRRSVPEKEVVVETPPVYKEKVDFDDSSSNYHISGYQGLYEGSERKDKKSGFTPSPIISPIYGILDKNYRKEEIVTKKEIRLSVSSNKKVDLDYVREKAYGDLASEITESIHEEVHDVEDKEKDSLLEDNLLYDLSEEESPAVKVVTVGDAEEYFNDLGLEYNVDYKVEKEVRDEEEKKSDKVVTRRVDRKKNELLNENDSLDVEEVTDEVKDKNNEDSNLFDLIDSMYEDKE